MLLWTSGLMHLEQGWSWLAVFPIPSEFAFSSASLLHFLSIKRDYQGENFSDASMSILGELPKPVPINCGQMSRNNLLKKTFPCNYVK